MFYGKISEQLSSWFIKPSNQATQETTCEFMPQLRWMETPDPLCPCYFISALCRCSPIPDCWHPSAFWAPHAFEWTLVKASVQSEVRDLSCSGFLGGHQAKWGRIGWGNVALDYMCASQVELVFSAWIKAAVWWEAFVHTYIIHKGT